MPIKPSWEERTQKGKDELKKTCTFTKEEIKKLVEDCLKENNISGNVNSVYTVEEIKKVYSENKYGHIIWIQFVANHSHVAVVGAGKDISFSHDQRKGTWKILSQLKKNGEQVEWDTSEVIVATIEGLDTSSYGIKNVTNILKCRNGVEHCIGEYLIQKGVRILNFYSHKNYSETFWGECKLKNYNI